MVGSHPQVQIGTKSMINFSDDYLVEVENKDFIIRIFSYIFEKLFSPGREQQ